MDCMIEYPEYGKDTFNGNNAFVKRYLIRKYVRLVSLR